MDKPNSGKSGKNRRKSNVDSKLRDTDAAGPADDHHNDDKTSLDIDQHISAEIDCLVHEFSTVNDKSVSPEIPNSVDTFVRIIKLRIRGYNSIKSGMRFGKLIEDDPVFTDSIRRLSRLKFVLAEFPNTASFDKINNVLQQAMAFMEDEFQALLLDESVTKGVASKSSSVKSDHSPTSTSETSELNNEQEFPGYYDDKVSLMNKIAAVMIPAGYQYECCQVYSTVRRDGLYEQVKKFGFEKVNVEDVHKSRWSSLEPDISRWIKLAKHCSDVLFPAERKLGESVFSDHRLVFTRLFINILRGVIASLIDFATAVATMKPKAKRLFKFLDIYEALGDLGDSIAGIDDSDSDPDPDPDPDSDDVKQECNNLKSEISSARDNIGEAVMHIFNDLKNSVLNDTNKTPIQGGAVHPVTRYVMNYLKCAFDEYQHTMEHIFRQHVKVDLDEYSPFSRQLVCVLDLLDANLDTKSGLYKDPSLRCIFLMNNDRFILQMVKGTKKMKEIMGDDWVRRKSSDVRNYHKSYQRETWNKVLQCITQEVPVKQGKPMHRRRILKERLKCFNAMLDEIYKTQSTWVVNDEQLLSEIRVSITAVVSPAYRSFIGRYRPQLQAEGAKSIDKYIKYQPEDIESMMETLFQGTEKDEDQINAIQTASTVKQTTEAFKNLLKTYRNVGLM